MIGFIKRLFTKKQPTCQHRLNWAEHKFMECGEPTVRFTCQDCGFYDRGHFITADGTTPEVMTRCVNGTVTTETKT